MYRNLLDALIALFQLFTLDHWYEIYNNLSAVAGATFTCAYILLWLWVGSFVFRNLFVGIMGESTCLAVSLAHFVRGTTGSR